MACIWSDTVLDQHWRDVAAASGQSPGNVIAVYLHILTAASFGEPLNADTVAASLDIDRNQVNAILWKIGGVYSNGESVAVPAAKPERRKPVAKLPVVPSDKGDRFAAWFKTLLPDDINLAPAWRVSWARAFDDMVRLDKRTHEEIAAVCKWARADAFWSGNFLTPAKLRQRDPNQVQYFDRFKADMKKVRRPQNESERKEANAHREHGLKPSEVPVAWNPLTDPDPE